MSASGFNSDLAGKAAGGRRLIAVVYADMVGYSRLIGLDDTGTLGRLRSLRWALIDPTVREHGGNIVQTGGDSLLVAFDSIDGAVRCAIKVQQQIPIYDGDQPRDRRIRFRVGIDMGDAILDGTDLHRDAVNIAARLEAKSPEGGICVSRPVRDHMQGRLDLAFEPIGELTLKNIARPVEAFVLRLDQDTVVQRSTAKAELEQPWPSKALGAIGARLLAIVASGGWWKLRDRTSAPIESTVAPTTARYPQDRRMSVIVLPFENSSGDPAQDGIAAGFARDVMSLLGQNRVPVIPAATSAVYRGNTTDLHKVGRDHNVHFAITGDARRQGGRLITSAALYRTDYDRIIWSKRFDSPDRSDERNSIAQRISVSIIHAMTDAEVERAQRDHPNSLDKLDLYLAAQATSLSSATKHNFLARIALIDRALAIDPDYVLALNRKSLLFASLVAGRFSSDRDADLATAIKAADRALQLAPNNVSALRRKAFVLRVQGNLDGAAALARKAIELEPLEGWCHRELGQIEMAQGRYKEALESFMTAKRLIAETSPFVDQSLACGLLANDRFPEAIAQAQLAMAEWTSEGGPDAEIPWLVLIAGKSENRQPAEARAYLQKFLATPRTYRSIAEVQKMPQLAGISKLLEGLRRAGMPSE
jgi:adenylate cyclase